MSAEVRLSLSRCLASLQRYRKVMDGSGLTLIPMLLPQTPPALIEAVASLGWPTLACRDVRTASTLTDSQCGSRLWLLERTPARQQLLTLLTQCDASVACAADHFVHAERLADTAHQADTEIDLLLEVSPDVSRPGLRPGHEATQLAAAALRLPRIRAVSVFTDECASLWTNGPFVSSPDLRETRSAFRTTAGMCAKEQLVLRNRAVQIPCRTVGTDWHESVTDILSVVPLFPETAPSTEMDQSPALSVRCRVVSRPSLTTAVIDVGADLLGCANQPPMLIGAGDADPLQLGADWLSLSLKGAARDLVIGDAVELAVPATTSALRAARVIE